MKIQTVCAVLVIILLSGAFSGCAGAPQEQQSIQPLFASYKDVSGITDDEIDDIEALQMKTDCFVFGMLQSTEMFRDIQSDEFRGYSTLLCHWLTELFDIEFRPTLYEWGDLLSGLDSKEIDFTGELTATDERRLKYLMTDPIAVRVVKSFRLEGSQSLDEIAKLRPIRCIFLGGSITIADITSQLTNEYEVIPVYDYDAAYEKLVSGEGDIFFSESNVEAAFDKYTDVVVQDHLPLHYSPVSMATQNKELASIISVVQKILQTDEIHYLTELYKQGYNDYLKNKLYSRFTVKEREYISNHPVVLFAAEYENYPMSFYNKRENAWQGVVFDVLQAIEALTNLSFELVNSPNTEWPEILALLDSGEVSLVSELIRTPEREGLYLWPETVLLKDNYALISKSEHPNITVNEILYVSVGLARNTAYQEVFETWFPSHRNVTLFEGSEVAFDALGRGEVDMTMASMYKLLALTNFREETGYKANIIFDRYVESTFGFNINEDVLCSIVDKALVMIDTTGLSDQWTRKTYDYRMRLAQMQIPWISGASALLVILLFLLIFVHRNRNESKRLNKLVQVRTDEIESQRRLSEIVNNAAVLLLESDTADYVGAMNQGMKMIGRQLEADRVIIWLNSRGDDGKFYLSQVCQWVGENMRDDGLIEIAQDDLPNWALPLSRGEIINGPLSDQPKEEQELLTKKQIVSVLIIPIFLKNEFWGLVSFDDCGKKRIFSEEMVPLLRSWGLLAVGAIQRGSIAIEMKNTLNKLETVIKNYKGVIWSIDVDGIITTFNGQYLKNIGVGPEFLEGKPLAIARRKNRHLDIIENVEKTFTEGPQDWINDMDGGIFRSCTVPMYDSDGKIIGVVGSTDDVTETIKLQQDLESASRAKSEFLANMSHEIRTPMNAIIGMTTIAESSDDIEKKNYAISKIKGASNHLLGVINDVLDISKIEANKFELSPVTFVFEKMLQRVIGVINFRIDEKQQHFIVNVDKAIPKTLVGDEQRLAQVMTNLLSNAIKFTPEQGSITLDARLMSTEDDNCLLQISIADTGIGITGDQMARMFRPFEQADAGTSRKFGGTGLGLAISNSIVGMMGGDIWVESEPESGSTFTFTAWLKQADDEPSSLSEDDAPKQGASIEELYNFEGHTILLAEDVEINREIVVALLAPTRLIVECAENGIQAVEMFESAPDRYDVVFMDVQMPEMDGYEATRAIRALGFPRAKTIPIIAMTANVFREDVQNCLDAGMNGHVGKPINLDDVLRQLKTLITSGA